MNYFVIFITLIFCFNLNAEYSIFNDFFTKHEKNNSNFIIEENFFCKVHNHYKIISQGRDEIYNEIKNNSSIRLTITKPMNWNYNDNVVAKVRSDDFKEKTYRIYSPAESASGNNTIGYRYMATTHYEMLILGHTRNEMTIISGTQSKDPYDYIEFIKASCEVF